MSRASWASEDPRHVAVHVEDVAPERIAGRSSSALAADTEALYALLSVQHVTPWLDRFVDRVAAGVPP